MAKIDSDSKRIRQKFINFFVNKKLKKIFFYFFSCILFNYMPHEITKWFEIIPNMKIWQLVSFWGVLLGPGGQGGKIGSPPSPGIGHLMCSVGVFLPMKFKLLDFFTYYLNLPSKIFFPILFNCFEKIDLEWQKKEIFSIERKKSRRNTSNIILELNDNFSKMWTISEL